MLLFSGNVAEDKRFRAHRVYLRRNIVVFWVSPPSTIGLIVKAVDIDFERDDLDGSLKLGIVINVRELRYAKVTTCIRLVILLLFDISPAPSMEDDRISQSGCMVSLETIPPKSRHIDQGKRDFDACCTGFEALMSSERTRLT